MAFARPYSQAERDLALAKMNATQPQVPVQPAPGPMPTPMNPLGQAQFGQYADYSAPWGAPTSVQGSLVGPGAGAATPATNPLLTGLQDRAQAMQAFLANLVAHQQGLQTRQGLNYQTYKDILSQPGPQMSLPDRQSPDLGGQAASGALQFLAALAGARPQFIQPMQAVGVQQQHNRDQGFQDEYMRRQFQYQADLQRRQDQERAAQADIASTNSQLQRDDSGILTAQGQLNTIEKNLADMGAKISTEAGKNARAEMANKRIKEIAAMKDPQAQANAIIEESRKAVQDPNSPFYQNMDGAMKFYGADLYYKQAAAQNLQSVKERRSKLLEEEFKKLQLGNTKASLDIDKLRKDLANYDDDRAVRIAHTLAEIDDMHFRQQHYGDMFDSKSIDSEEKLLSTDEENFSKFLKEKDSDIQGFTEKIAKLDPDIDKDQIAQLKALRDDAARARDLAASEVPKAIFERRQKLRDLRAEVAQRAKSSVPPKPPTSGKSKRPPPMKGELPPAPPIPSSMTPRPDR